MTTNKTIPTGHDVESFLASVEPGPRQSEARRLDQVFRAATGFAPQMWGPSIIGYGRYHYRYASGREGDMCATGFSPRKGNHVIYIMPGYTDFSEILSRLGKHKMGKSCLYISRLDQISTDVLAELIGAGLADLDSKWPVMPT